MFFLFIICFFDVACLVAFLHFPCVLDSGRQRIPHGPGGGQLREAKPLFHAEPVFPAEHSDDAYASATGGSEF